MKQKNLKLMLVIIAIVYSNCPYCLTSNEMDTKTYLKQAQEFVKDKKIDKAKQTYFFLLKTLLGKKQNIEETACLEAIQYCKDILKIDPQEYMGYFFWAIALTHLDKKGEALKKYIKAIKLKPNSSASWYNAALLLRQMEKAKESLYFYESAITLAPNNEDFHFGIAQAYLVLGDFKNGWHHMELGRTRFLQQLTKRITAPDKIKGKTVLIPKGWGYGDLIQFARYAKLIKQHGGTVMMHVHKPIAKILSTCHDIDKITIEQPKPHEYDAQIALWSLPSVFEFSEEEIAKDIPYLHADPALVYYWGKRLEHDKNFKVGICWSGSGACKKIKDIPLEKFEPLSRIPGVTLYSLQKGGGEQLKHIAFNIVDLSDELDTQNGPFMDTAALMKNLDLVITVDTSIAHLAGALAVPVWTYIIFAPDWRWMLERTDTPWYPTMKLFRGRKPYDYEHVIQNMKTTLKRMLNQS